MKNKKLSFFLLLAIVCFCFVNTTTFAKEMVRGSGPVIYVISQDLYYDSVIAADPLPPQGKFQLLEKNGTLGKKTEYGPGDKEYTGGRWKEIKEDGTYHYFSSLLLAPGRKAP